MLGFSSHVTKRHDLALVCWVLSLPHGLMIFMGLAFFFPRERHFPLRCCAHRYCQGKFDGSTRRQFCDRAFLVKGLWGLALYAIRNSKANSQILGSSRTPVPNYKALAGAIPRGTGLTESCEFSLTVYSGQQGRPWRIYPYGRHVHAVKALSILRLPYFWEVLPHSTSEGWAGSAGGSIFLEGFGE